MSKPMNKRHGVESEKMDQVIDFYFDFISPYGYFAAMQIEAVARRHNYTVRWHVFRLGVAVVKVMGLRPLMETPLKNTYVLRDIERLSTIYALPIVPTIMAPDPVLLGSAFYAVEEANADFLPTFAKQLFARIWQHGDQVRNVGQLVSIAHRAGMNVDRMFSPSAMEVGRLRLKDATGDAIERGIFGSPTFVVGNEMIWGVDRLWMLEHYMGKHPDQNIAKIL
jgi:2-hydroxychromene-2-carboxylate isomerase